MKKLLLAFALFLSLSTSSFGATVAQDNFEHNLNSGVWDVSETDGTVTTSSTQAHSGTYSLKCDVTTDDGLAMLDLGDTVEVMDTVYIRFWIYVPQAVFDDIDNENDNGVGFLDGYDEDWAGLINLSIYYWDAFFLNVDYNDWGSSLSTSVFSADAWHCIEIYLLRDAVAGAISLYVDGTLADSDTGVDTGDKDLTRLYLGGSYSANCKGTIYVDDLVIDSANYIGTGYRVTQGGAVGSPFRY